MSQNVAPRVGDKEAVVVAERTKSFEYPFLNYRGDLPALANLDAAPGFRSAEIILPNGDTYCGTFLGNTPEGSGKYVWADGCVYEGEWRRGMKHGNGKLRWPSGGVYEGEFSGGYMHGTGTYSLPDQLTYKGRWRLSLKHGLGYQVYANRYAFEGSWIQGKPEGLGKYTWADGNFYVGNMKGGKMYGKGTLTWTNGDMFEGCWLNGRMHGFGIYTWRDRGFYVGTWTHGLKDGKGVFYPSNCTISGTQALYLTALRKRGLLPDFRTHSQLPRINHASNVDIGNAKFGMNHGSTENTSGLWRTWSLEASVEKVLRHVSSLTFSHLVFEDVEKDDEKNNPILEREYMQGVLISELVVSNRISPRQAQRLRKELAKKVKKPGEIIIKGHSSYDLMLNLQLGIRYTVGKITHIPRQEIQALDFGHRACFRTNFPSGGSRLTPCHHSQDFKWKDYCPMVFRNLREMFKIDAADYMMSICGNDALRELSSPGKSGSIFFLSQDDHFMIKTLRKSEVKVLLQMLPNYYNHVRTYDNTLITKFFGLHSIKPSSGQKFRFVVMGNMFCTELRIHRRFDLKGSSLGRSVYNVQIDENTILKDLDLKYCFYLEPSWREGLLKQIEIDSNFLESQHIMDYSLLLGVHYRAPQMLRAFKSSTESAKVDALESLSSGDFLEEGLYPESLVLVAHGADDTTAVVGPHIRGGPLRATSATGNKEVDLLLGTTRLQIQLGVNMPARAERFLEEAEGSFHEVYDVILYLGIIDILQEYDTTKRIEHAYKSIQFDSVSISAVDPTFYSVRFLEFIRKVFPPNVAASSQ